MDFADIFAFLKARLAQGQPCVLVTVCAVEGSSMRNPGTLMGVARDGAFTGSLSGGCIENAVVAEALDALDHGAARIVRFGAGSPYLDIKLPCGGGLDVHFQPLHAGTPDADTPDADRLCTDRGVVDAALASIARRAPFALAHDGTQLRHIDDWRPPSPLAQGGRWSFGYWPAPRLQIVGHGAGVEALARLALETGCAVSVLTPDAALLADLEARAIPAQRLARIDQTQLLSSDAWTATIFLFHDHDWEIALMARALDMPHFYLGAMGGRRAHAFRSEALLARGVSAPAIAAIHAPIGLFHSSRDPHTLALSTLAEVIKAYQHTDFEAALG